jgi:Tol biopolymer transport system component
VPLIPQGNGEFSPGETECQTCKVVLANGTPSSTNSTGQSENPVVSADGQWLAFQTTSTDLLAAGTPCPTSSSQVMLRNMLTGSTRSISAPASGGSCGSGTAATNPSMDFSGQNIVFVSTQPLAPNDNNGGSDVFLFKPTTGVSQISRSVLGSASSPVTSPVISGNGRIIAFTSGATNLDSREPDNNDSGDIFVHRVRGGRLGILAKNRRGAQVTAASQRPSLPYTGGFLAFDSVAENVTDKPKGGQSSVYKRANALAAESLFDAGFE